VKFCEHSDWIGLGQQKWIHAQLWFRFGVQLMWSLQGTPMMLCSRTNTPTINISTGWPKKSATTKLPKNVLNRVKDCQWD